MSIQKAKCDPLFKADAGRRTSQNTAGESPAPLSNEELAIQVKAGDRLAIAQLWKQVQCLTYWHALRFFNAHRAACASCGVEIEDVQQEAFFALLAAVKAFDAEKGYRFTTYLRFHLKTRFNSLIGCRGNTPPRPLDKAKSLDEPIAGEDDDLALLDLIVDPEASGAFEDAEEREYTRQLHAALSKALALLDDQQAQILRARYYSGLTLKDCAQRAGVTPERVRQIENKALRNMRRGARLRLLCSFRAEIISAKAYKETGFQAWKSRGSREESLLEYLDDRFAEMRHGR